MIRSLLLASLMLAACSRPDNSSRRSDTATVAPPVSVAGVDTLPKSCGVAGDPVLTEEGIGELRRGRSIAEVAALCAIVSDSRELGAGGMRERVLVLQIAGETVRAIVVDERIWRIEINTPWFRTIDSLGVDAPLKRIGETTGAQFAPGEDGVYAFVPDHCGLSFRFSLPLRPPAGGQWTARSITLAHADAAVDRVLVSACRR